jgi:hypothetical protein
VFIGTVMTIKVIPLPTPSIGQPLPSRVNHVSLKRLTAIAARYRSANRNFTGGVSFLLIELIGSQWTHLIYPQFRRDCSVLMQVVQNMSIWVMAILDSGKFF